MPVAIETVETVTAIGGGPGGLPPHGGDGGGGRGDGGALERHRQICRTGIWVALAPILMLFAAFCSAYIVRRGLSGDWRPLELPAVLWLNTALLLASSLSLEQARACLLRSWSAGFNRWWSATTVLGGGFLLGQLVAWRQLAVRGLYLASNPSSSFFYLLTASHGLHLLGGLLALLYVLHRALRLGVGPARQTAVEVTAIYWHFLGGLWICLFLLLLLWR